MLCIKRLSGMLLLVSGSLTNKVKKKYNLTINHLGLMVSKCYFFKGLPEILLFSPVRSIVARNFLNVWR